jgi:DNA polymerase-3 subunit epsilon
VRYIAILDTETTGTDPSTHTTVEVAVMLFDLKHAQPSASFASLIKGPAQNEAAAINNIPPEMIPEAREPDMVWRAVNWIIEPAEVVVAHNAEFDKQFCPDFGKPWACSENDFKWPGRARGGNLVGLALSLGLGVASAHRAMADVDTLARVLTRLGELGHDLEALVTHAMRPKQKFKAILPYELRQEAKDAGFRWDGDTKTWWRVMAPEDTKELPFKVKVIG